MEISPFDFKIREIDSAIRFTNLIIVKAKYCMELIDAGKYKPAEIETIRLCRAIVLNESNYEHIRQYMDKNRLENKLVKNLKELPREAGIILGIYRKKKTLHYSFNIIIPLLGKIRLLGRLLDTILELFEKKVRLGKNEYFAVINAGGTRSRCIIIDRNGNPVGTGGKRSILPAFPTQVGYYKSIDSVVKSIKLAIKNAAKNAKLNLKTTYFRRIVIGLAGVDLKTVHLRLSQILTAYILNFHPNIKDIIVLPDNLVSWYSALDGNPGIIVMGGTGHYIYGYNNGLESSNTTTQVEKLSSREMPFLGGRNLSFNCAKLLLEQIAQNKTSLLSTMVKQAYIQKKLFPTAKTLVIALEDIFNFYALKGGKLRIISDPDSASLAPYVIRAAQQKDVEAVELIEKASHNICLAISCVAKDIGLHEKFFFVSYVGGVISRKFILKKIRNHIKSFEPEAKIINPIIASEEEGLIKIAMNNIRFY